MGYDFALTFKIIMLDYNLLKILVKEIISQVKASIFSSKIGSKPILGWIPKSSTLNPEPWTLNPEPWKLNSQPSTLNPECSTLNPEPMPGLKIDCFEEGNSKSCDYTFAGLRVEGWGQLEGWEVWGTKSWECGLKICDKGPMEGWV